MSILFFKKSRVFSILLLLPVFLLFFVQFARADFDPAFDVKGSIMGRTHPLGAQFALQGGASQVLWGDTGTFKYGYIRLGTNLATAVLVNRVGIEAQVFPISIFGITAGYDLGVRNFVAKYLDCSIYECVGRVDRKYLKNLLFFGHREISFMSVTRFEELKSPNTQKPFFDEVTLLSGRNYGERMLTFNPVLLYTLDETSKVGFLSLYTRALDSGGYSHMYGPLYMRAPTPEWNGIVGLGLNSSARISNAFTAFFAFQYNFSPSLAITDLKQRSRTYSSLF